MADQKYAIIRSGCKQYRVSQGDIICVEMLPNEIGSKLEFKEVLLFNSGTACRVGAPIVQNCRVEAELLGEAKGPKVVIYKYKRRKNCRRKTGHRQHYHRVKITAIEG